MKKTAVKVLSSIVGIVGALIALFVFVIYIPYINYTNTHTWATISVVAEIHSDVDEVLTYTDEYLQDDTIDIANMTLLVKDITIDGEVTFKVQQGNLYDDNGNPITSFIMNVGKKESYKTDNGYVTISVDSNRYQ